MFAVQATVPGYAAYRADELKPIYRARTLSEVMALALKADTPENIGWTFKPCVLPVETTGATS